MAYFGKEFSFDKEENYEAFINSLVDDADFAKRLLTYRPNQVLEKNGDEYTLKFLDPNRPKEYKFKNGVPFDETVRDGLEGKNTFTVDGDTFVQLQEFGGLGSITFKREYTADTLKLTMTHSKWDGVAYRWYKAV